ncbi:MAG: hypothetical protein ACRDU5_19620 [Mycobacterium sp.]
MPTLSDPDKKPEFDTSFTNEPPRDVESEVPPYEGRKTEADAGFTESQGAKTGGATGPTADAEPKSPKPGAGGSTKSPADEQPASRGSESDTDDDMVGPGHVSGAGRAEDKR